MGIWRTTKWTGPSWKTRTKLFGLARCSAATTTCGSFFWPSLTSMNRWELHLCNRLNKSQSNWHDFPECICFSTSYQEEGIRVATEIAVDFIFICKSCLCLCIFLLVKWIHNGIRLMLLINSCKGSYWNIYSLLRDFLINSYKRPGIWKRKATLQLFQ